jgi:hypothetical protein
MKTGTSEDAMQLALERPEWFEPVGLGSAHYVAALQNKRGELDALRNASPDTWARMTPLLQIVGPKKPLDPFRAQRVAEWVKKLAAVVGDRPCFLDILRLNPRHPTERGSGTTPVLAAIHAAARRRRLPFVPVLPLGRDHGATYAALVRDAALCDGRGAAIRYPLLTMALAPGQTHTSVLAEALKQLGIAVTAADVILDLGYMSGDEGLEPEDMAQAVHEVAAVGAWRSIVLLGTSMPRMLGGGVIAEGEVGEIPRREWDLWLALKAARPKRLPTYGDYAVQHPSPPHGEDGGGNSMRANIRYTAAGRTLVARGRGPVIQAGKGQYRDLCKMLAERSEFAGKDYSWGDRVIQECADGRTPPGAQDRWRGAGTSHHLRLATEQVSR